MTLFMDIKREVIKVFTGHDSWPVVDGEPLGTEIFDIKEFTDRGLEVVCHGAWQEPRMLVLKDDGSVINYGVVEQNRPALIPYKRIQEWVKGVGQ